MILAGNEDEHQVRRALNDAVEAGRPERDEEHVWLVGLRHVDEVATQLREWGYDVE